MHWLRSLAVLALLVMMIYKPGAVIVSAAVRPDSWNFPLLLHVLGAMLLVGALILAASTFLLTWRGGSAPLARLGYRAMLLGALASWILMRVGAEWTASKEGLTDANLSWLDIGSTTADGGLVLIIVATVLAGLEARRASGAAGSGAALGRASAVLVSLLIVAYLVSVWAMTTKPA